MLHRIPDKNWHMCLAWVLRESQDNDIILVSTDAQKELAERAKTRMCPEKKLIIKKDES